MIGYKAFDSNLKCNGFQYEIGKTYEFDGDIELCAAGFHFCENIADCFTYYPESNARFAKVKALGEVIKSDYNSKCVTDKIRIIEEISMDDAIKMSNSGNCNTGSGNIGDHNGGNGNIGNRNTGDRNIGCENTGIRNAGDRNDGCGNTGYRNTGNRNTGYRNTGNRNTGDRNTGDCNVGDKNTGYGNIGNDNVGDWNKSSSNNGCFMTVSPTIMMFNKPSNWTINDWQNSLACSIMRSCPTDYTDNIWIMAADMTDKEKIEHPGYKTTGGYLKVIKHEADKQRWWDNLSYSDKQEIISLPNFDASIFYECTGIKV